MLLVTKNAVLQWVVYLFIYFINVNQKAREGHGVDGPKVLSDNCSMCLWVAEWANVFTFVQA